MILKAKHHAFIYPFFKWYSRWIIKKHFDRVIIYSSFKDKGLPVMLLSNHVSWWDGFWVMYVNLKLLHRKFHFMMLRSQLSKYWFFNYSGGYSVEKKSRSILESINYTAELLSGPANLVLIFPQGKIQSMHKQTFEFQNGIERILEKVGRENVQIVFLVNLTDYLSRKKPALYQYLEEYYPDSHSADEIQEQYNAFYQKCIANQIKFEE